MTKALALGFLAMSLAALGCSNSDRDLPPAYRAVAVPAARLASAAAAARGRALFREHCALCHGINADGHGVRRAGMARPPTNFTDPLWRRRTTPRHVFFAIREGVHGTTMAAWKGTLDAGQTWDLVAYLLAASRQRS
jgi:mono/diheme cytochrome c family protein